MSGKKISEMTAITGAQLDQTNDVLPVLDVSDTTNPNKKISIQELASVIGASGTTNVDLSLDGSNNLTLTDSDNNTVTVDLSALNNAGLTLADVTANGAVTSGNLTVLGGNIFGTDGLSTEKRIRLTGDVFRSYYLDNRILTKSTIGADQQASVTLDIQGTDAVQLTSGTTAERPVTPANGMIRYNSDDDVFEGYDGDWGAIVKQDSATRTNIDSILTGTDVALRLNTGEGAGRFSVNASGKVFCTGGLQTTFFEPTISTVYLSSQTTAFLQNSNAVAKTHFRYGSVDSVTVTESKLGILNTSPAVTLDIQGTDAVQLTSGTTAQRPTAAAGMIRFNTTTSKFEGYDGTAWIDLN